MRYADSDLLPFLEGAVAVRRDALGVWPVRLSDRTLDFTHPALRDPFTAEAANGIRLRFVSASPEVRLHTQHIVSPSVREAAGSGRMTMPAYDVVVDGELVHRTRVDDLDGDPRTVALPVPTGEIVEVWLPHNVGVRILALEATGELVRVPDDRRRWVTYGSSITHGAASGGPSETWPALVARRRGLHLTNLGFRGQCHADPFIGRAIGESPADLISVKIGINIHNQQSLRERTFAPMVHGFLESIRDGRPSTPLWVISPVFSFERENSPRTLAAAGSPPRVGDLTVRDMRDALRQVVAVRRTHGDTMISYIDGLDLLGAADAGRFPDGLHPDPEGMRLMADRFDALWNDAMEGPRR
jgi:hypothetical protein